MNRMTHEKKKVTVIAGAFFQTEKDSLHHIDEFRLYADDVLMTLPNLKKYFTNNRRFPSPERDALRRISSQRPYQQIHYNGIHLFSFLERNGFETDVINCFNPEEARIRDALNRESLAIVISTTFLTANQARMIVSSIRGWGIDAPVIIGGPLVNQSLQVYRKRDNPYYAVPEVRGHYFFQDPEKDRGIDYFIFDKNGERTLLKLLEAISSGARYSDNVAWYEKGASVFGPETPENYDINDFAIAWEKVPVDRISSVMPFSASFGCPFSCAFCNFTDTSYQVKRLDVIREELRKIAELRFVERVWFTDDNLLLTPRNIMEFCTMMIEEDFPFTWCSFIRSNSITPEIAGYLKRSKMDMAMIGLESGSPKMLSLMNKKDKVENYRKTLALLSHAEIDMEVSVIVGFPGETRETVNETIALLNSIPPSGSINYLYIFQFTVAPLSPIFENRGKSGLSGNYVSWSHKTMDSAEAQEQCKRVFLESERLFMKYLDPPCRDNVWQRNVFELRQNIVKCQLSGDVNTARETWAHLEKAIMAG